uniref:Uncharacterized protein n=1 Tax=Candidatus Kentrum sp. TC TaxID=2126339 RepID=A0A450ZDA2_9GAMM|nr:MAG: hypothetical protein BECKTC1821D_GA0114238_11395 [Candidatus Kentron sp. TC]
MNDWRGFQYHICTIRDVARPTAMYALIPTKCALKTSTIGKRRKLPTSRVTGLSAHQYSSPGRFIVNQQRFSIFRGDETAMFIREYKRRLSYQCGRRGDPAPDRPFVVLGFHSDNGSEHINKRVAALLDKLLIELTKSRAAQQ